MARYETITPWEAAHGAEFHQGNFSAQVADIRDKRTGATYRDGAYRVIDVRTDKAAVRGKGGTHPFYGETAWMGAARLVGDLDLKERMSRS